jgi:hypothetical protein
MDSQLRPRVGGRSRRPPQYTYAKLTPNVTARRDAPSRTDLISSDYVYPYGVVCTIKFWGDQVNLEDAIQRLRRKFRAVKKIVESELGNSYAVSSMAVNSKILELRVTTYPEIGRPLRWQKEPAQQGISGEIWVAKADRASEMLRRRLDKELSLGSKGIELYVAWTPETGIERREPLGIDTSEHVLRARRIRLRTQQRQIRQRLQTTFLIMVASLMVTSGAIYFIVKPPWPTDPFWPGLVATYSTVFALAGLLAFILLLNDLRDLGEDAREAEAGLELGELLDVDQKRAHKLFQLNSAEVRRYYDQALRQRRYVFYLGVLCILGGFASVFIAFYLITRTPAPELPEKIVIAILGTVSGVLANFVALIFLNMFSTIVKSMVDFHQRLVATHHVVFSNVLIARIEDKKLREHTLAEVALALSEKTASKKPKSGSASAEPPQRK